MFYHSLKLLRVSCSSAPAHLATASPTKSTSGALLISRFLANHHQQNTAIQKTSSSSSSLLTMMISSKVYQSSSASASSQSPSVSSLIAPARSNSLHDLAMTQCPLCHVPCHIKEVLRHLNNDHRPEETETQIDKQLIRKLVRERYTALHTAIKQVWAKSSPKGAVPDKSKGGFPCRHCPRDETGLPPLFATVDALMKHIGKKHEEPLELDMDDEEVPKRLSADDVNQKIEFLRNGTNSGLTSTVINDIVNGGNDHQNNNKTTTQSKLQQDGSATTTRISVDEVMNAPSAPSSSSSSLSNNPNVLAYRCEFCNKQTDRELDMLQHYDNAHGDIVFDLGLSKKLLLKDFIDHHDGEDANAMLMSNSGDDDNQSERNTLDDCWTKPVLAPYQGIPKVLTIPYSPPPRHSSSSSSSSLDPSQIPAAPPSPPGSKKSAALSESDESVVSETSSSLPPPPPQQQESLAASSGTILDITEAPPPPPPQTPTTTSSAKNKLPSFDDVLSSSSSLPQQQQQTAESFMQLRCEHCGQKMKSAMAYEYHLKDKHGIIVDLISAEANMMMMTGGNISSPSPSSSSTSSLDSLPYHCTFGSCHRKQFTSKQAFEAHVQAKHPEIDFNEEIIKIDEERRRRFEAARTSSAQSTQSSPASASSSPSPQEKLALALVCKECGKTGFKNYNAFASHMSDAHGIEIERYVGGVNTRTTANIFSSLSTAGQHQQVAENAMFAPSQQQVDATYECEHCGKAFSTFNGYDNHVRSKHNISPSRPIIRYAAPQQQQQQQTQNPSSPLNFAPPSFPADLAQKSARSKEHDEEAVWKESRGNSTNNDVQDDHSAIEQDSFLYGSDQQQQLSSTTTTTPPPPPPQQIQQNQNQNQNQLKSAWWCSTCNRGFASPQALQGHNVSKHGFRPASNIPCPAPGCKRTCADQFALLDHVKQAHKTDIQMGLVDISRYVQEAEQGHTCEQCGKKFLVERELDSHVMTSHSGVHRPSVGGGQFSTEGDAPRTGSKKFKRRF